MAKIEISFDDKCNQSLEHFISNSAWEDASLIAKGQRGVIKELNSAGQEDAGLILDENAFAKKKNAKVQR